MTVSSPSALPKDLIAKLPAPFNRDDFRVMQEGVYEHPDVTVYINTQNDFAFLSPQPDFNYKHYKSRVKSLNLSQYQVKNQSLERRLEKLKPYLGQSSRVLEVGAWFGAFLEYIHAFNPSLRLSCLEPDQSTKPERDALTWLEQFSSFDELKTKNETFDVVCFFHVLEHIADPKDFLANCRQLLAKGGRVILEVPSLDDPLLSLYKSSKYQEFYFQVQHPYVYSRRSMARLLEHHGFAVEHFIPHQRYGLENHLTWLTEEKPGGSDSFRTLFEPIDANYRKQLEVAGQTDAIIAIAQASTQESVRP